MWPGFGENMRVLKWVVERCEGKARAAESALGMMPRYEDLDWRGLELNDHRAHFAKYQSRLLEELNAVLREFEHQIV